MQCNSDYQLFVVLIEISNIWLFEIIETENIINIQYDKLYHYKYFLAELKRLQTELTEQLSEDTSQSSQTYLCPADPKGKLVDEDFLSAPDTDEDVPFFGTIWGNVLFEKIPKKIV